MNGQPLPLKWFDRLTMSEKENHPFPLTLSLSKDVSGLGEGLPPSQSASARLPTRFRSWLRQPQIPRLRYALGMTVMMDDRQMAALSLTRFRRDARLRLPMAQLTCPYLRPRGS